MVNARGLARTARWFGLIVLYTILMIAKSLHMALAVCIPIAVRAALLAAATAPFIAALLFFWTGRNVHNALTTTPIAKLTLHDLAVPAAAAPDLFARSFLLYAIVMLTYTLLMRTIKEPEWSPDDVLAACDGDRERPPQL